MADLLVILIPFGLLYCINGMIHAFKCGGKVNPIKDATFIAAVLIPSVIILVITIADSMGFIAFRTLSMPPGMLTFFEASIGFSLVTFFPIEIHIAWHELAQTTPDKALFAPRNSGNVGVANSTQSGHQ